MADSIVDFVRHTRGHRQFASAIDLLDRCDRRAHYDWRPIHDEWAAACARDLGAVEALCGAVLAAPECPARAAGDNRPAEDVRRDLRARRTCARVWEGVWRDDAPMLTYDEEAAHLLAVARERAAQLRREREASYAADDRARDHARDRARKALNSCCSRVASSEKGGRNYALNRAAYALGGYVAIDLLDEADVVEALTAAGIAAGLNHRDARHPVVLGIAKGKGRPMDLRRGR